MSIVCERDLLSAAGYLSNAADNLRAIGLLRLAAEIDAFIATLDAEILLRTVTDEFKQAIEPRRSGAKKP
jgi:hypothetical protein